jgi:hypothetical protein
MDNLAFFLLIISESDRRGITTPAKSDPPQSPLVKGGRNLSEFPLVKAGHSSLYIIKFDNNLIDLGKAQI